MRSTLHFKGTPESQPEECGPRKESDSSLSSPGRSPRRSPRKQIPKLPYKVVRFWHIILLTFVFNESLLKKIVNVTPQAFLFSSEKMKGDDMISFSDSKDWFWIFEQRRRFIRWVPELGLADKNCRDFEIGKILARMAPCGLSKSKEMKDCQILGTLNKSWRRLQWVSGKTKEL